MQRLLYRVYSTHTLQYKATNSLPISILLMTFAINLESLQLYEAIQFKKKMCFVAHEMEKNENSIHRENEFSKTKQNLVFDWSLGR